MKGTDITTVDVKDGLVGSVAQSMEENGDAIMEKVGEGSKLDQMSNKKVVTSTANKPDNKLEKSDDYANSSALQNEDDINRAVQSDRVDSSTMQSLKKEEINELLDPGSDINSSLTTDITINFLDSPSSQKSENDKTSSPSTSKSVDLAKVDIPPLVGKYS